MNNVERTAKDKLTRWGTISGIGLIALGIIVILTAVGQVVRTTMRGMQQVSLPGVQQLELKEPGLYMGVYMQEAGAPLPPGTDQLAVSLAAIDHPTAVPVEKIPAVPFMGLGSRAGYLLFRFEAPSPGRYLINASYPAGAKGPALQVMLLNESMAQNKADLAAGAVICLVLCGAGLYVLWQSSGGPKAPPPQAKKKK